MHLPSIKEVKQAQLRFAKKAPRDLFYKAATELVDRVERGDSKLELAEAVSVLLQSWNRRYYNTHPPTERHYRDFQRTLDRYATELSNFRARGIGTFQKADQQTVDELFDELDYLLGPVGAAKALHLLAPQFFPIWDRRIASKGYGIYLQEKGLNAELYVRFMRVARDQCAGLGGAFPNPVKALDEWNYMTITNRPTQT
jgi:hypothetical protein